MNTFARPLPTKLAAAIVAAGVVSAGAVVEVPDQRVTPTIATEVAPASIVTDLLLDFGNLVSGTVGAFATLADAQTSLPYDIWTATLLAQQDSTLTPSLISWLVQRYANPSFAYPWSTYAQELAWSVTLIASALPPSIGQPIISGLAEFSDAINTMFSAYLPDSTPGEVATQFFWNNTVVGGLLLSANLSALTPIYLAANVATFLGYLPFELEATFESALRNPSEIPGLISNLVYDFASPMGLLGGIVYPLTEPFVALPGPIGEIALNLRNGFYGVVENLLDLLPPPVVPTPFAGGAAAAAGDESEGAPSATSDEVDEPQNDGGGEALALSSTSGGDAEDTEGAADEAEDRTEGTDDDAALSDDAEALSLSGAAKIKQGNKFAPGGGTEPADESTGADPAEEAESPTSADPESSDDGTDGSESDSSEAGGEAA